MKICILHIGHSEPGAKNKHPPSPERFQTSLAPQLPDSTWSTVSAVNGELPDPGDFDAYLITGGKYSVFDQYDWQDRLFDFLSEILEQNSPLVGVCYGHQAIAHILGAKVIRSPKGYGVGLMPVSVVGDRSWCRERSEPVFLHAMHQDQLIGLPKGAKLFLTSDFCPISGFSIGETVLAIQQHPDFTPDLNRDLIERRRERIGEDRASSAITSLDGRDDTAISIKWIADFLTGLRTT